MSISHFILRFYLYKVFTYMVVLTFCLTVYEYFITLDKEIALVWPQKFGYAKFLFLANRYLTIVTAFLCLYVPLLATEDKRGCTRLWIVCMVLLSISSVLSSGSLWLRTYAVWGFNPFIAIVSVLSILITAVSSIVFTMLFLRSTVLVQGSKYGLQHGCIGSFRNHAAWAVFVAIIINESLSFILLFIKNFQYRGSSLMQRMSRDGLIYYVAIIGLSVANIACMLSLTLNITLVIPQKIMTSILCSRLLIHIREVSDTVVGEDGSKDLENGRTVSGINFARDVSTIVSCGVNTRPHMNS